MSVQSDFLSRAEKASGAALTSLLMSVMSNDEIFVFAEVRARARIPQSNRSERSFCGGRRVAHLLASRATACCCCCRDEWRSCSATVSCARERRQAARNARIARALARDLCLRVSRRSLCCCARAHAAPLFLFSLTQHQCSTWVEYVAEKDALPALAPAHEKKLKQLSVVSMASQSKVSLVRQNKHLFFV